MKLHPAEIAKEIKSYAFFKNFSEDLLLQLCTMIETKSFSSGDILLKEGTSNTKLFFLRSGSAAVYFAGEVVTVLIQPGEVIGEISVATDRPVTTTVRATSDLECFVVDSENFKHVIPKDKDRLLVILYRLYTVILSDRLIKTNEKARLFEIANRELHEAQLSLEKAGEKNVLIVQSDKKQLLLMKLAVGGTGVNLDVAATLVEAEDLLKLKPYDAVLADEQHLHILEELNHHQNKTNLVLMASKEISKNFDLFKKSSFVGTLITQDADDRTFTIRSILTTLTKILSQDIFGIEKYLTWGAEIQLKTVSASDQRQELKEEMAQYFKKLGIRNSILENCSTVTEELLMNAIYDAPTDENGNPQFNHLTRKNKIVLDTHMQSRLRYATDGVMIAISVIDPFGSLKKDTIIRYLENCYSGKENDQEAQQKGGAGRGLHMIIENSDLTIFNVKSGVQTEVICLFNVEPNKKDHQPSFHYFFTEK